MKTLHLFLIAAALALTAVALTAFHEYREDARTRLLAPPSVLPYQP